MAAEPDAQIFQTPIDVRRTIEQSDRSSSKSPEIVAKYLYVTPFHIECGQEHKRFMVHRELMCSISPYIRHLCDEAEPLKNGADTLSKLCDWFLSNLEKGNAAAVNTERIDILTKISCNRINIGKQQEDLRKKIMIHTNATYMNTKNREPRNVPKGTENDPAQENVQGRLLLLKAPGVRKVAETCYEALKEYRRAESESSYKDPLQAVLQDTLILEEFESATVQVLIQWVYREILEENIGIWRLCGLYHLAHKLCMETFAELVMTRIIACIVIKVEGSQLSKDVTGPTTEGFKPEDSTHASEGTLTPTTQLGRIPTPLQEILSYVYSHKLAPMQLRTLAVETIAWRATPDEFIAFADRLTRQMALMLVQAALERLADIRAHRVEVGLMERLKHSHEKMKKASSKKSASR